MKRRINKASVIFVAAGILVFLCSSIYSIMVDRPLVRDGVVWAFRVLQYKRTSFGHNELRYFSSVFELPALLVSVLGMGPNYGRLAIKTWECTFTAMPYLFLAATYFFLARFRRKHLFVIPALSFATGTALGLVFSVCQVAEVASLFWLILVLLLYSDFSSRFELATMIACTLCLALSHEAAILAFILFFFIALVRFRHHPRPKIYLKFAILFFACAIGCIVRQHFGNYVTSHDFLMSMTRFNPILAYPVGLFVLIMGAAMAARFPKIRGKLELAAAGLGFVWLIWNWHDLATALSTKAITLRYYLDERSSGFIVTLMMGILLWAAGDRRRLWARTRFRFLISLLTFFTFIFAAHIDVLLSQQWKEGMSLEHSYEQNLGAGCHLIPVEKFQSECDPLGMSELYLPLLEIVLQGERSPRFINFVRDLDPGEKSPCAEIAKNRIPFRRIFFSFPPSGYFNLDKIKAAAR